jgi:spore germination protein GerM
MAGRLFAIGAVLGALALAGCDDAEDTTTTSSTQPTSTSAQTTTSTTAQQTDTSSDKNKGPQLYFTAGEQFKKVPADLPPGDAQKQVEAATQALIEGPPEAGRTTTQLPAGTRVEGVDVAKDGTATVEVSGEFLAGVPARAAARDDAQRQEIAARLGQLTYTLTQFDDVESVKVVAGGEPVEQEAQRADFAKPAQGPNFKTPPDGEKSSGTRQLQERLADLQYLPRSAVDGKDGYRTQQAVIAFQAWEGLERDGVAGPITQAALAKAKTPRPGNGGPSRRVEVYRDKGVALLIAHDRVKRAIHVSSGGPGTSTPAGTFEVYRKENPSWSVPFQVWLPYASYFTGGIAFHEYPDVPPYPASHGCVRVGSPEAPGVYRFAKLGTTVIVY